MFALIIWVNGTSFGLGSPVVIQETVYLSESLQFGITPSLKYQGDFSVVM